LVVLILVVLWIAVLTPRLVRHFREGRSQSSIDSFHEQLHLLERTGPKLVEPAHRLEVPEDEAPAGRLALVEGAAAEHATPHLVRGVRQRQSAWERRRGRRRRRDLLLGLVGLVAVTGGLGAMHALHLLWAITGVSALALAGYVALVAYAQMLHADRDAVRPVSSRQADVPVPSPAWAGSRPRHASLAFATPAVEVLSASSPRAARAGYPGAWDDDELVAVGRHAAGG
jgi:hypothetical protein